MRVEESGFIELQIGDTPAVAVDLYRANNQIFELQQKHGDDRGIAYDDGLCDLVASWGLPRPSVKAALQISGAILAQVEAELGKVEPAQPTSDSPG